MKTHAGWLPVLLLAAPGAARAQDEEDPRFFAIPMSRDARELAATAEEHLTDGRFEEGLALLQRLIEEHRGEVLPEEWRAGDTPSQFDAHPGAAEWARARLFSLTPRELGPYLQRNEPRAAEALQRALLAPSRRALVEVARRWPVVPSAARAWWCLGDLELEDGQATAARGAWGRARAIETLLGIAPSPGAEARLAVIRPESAEAGPLPEPGAGTLPRSEAQPWTVALELDPFRRGGGRGYHFNLLPHVAQERVLVSSSLQVFALDAFSGEVLWRAGPPAGWERLSEKRAEELFEGIHYEQTLSGPVASGGVALAALQIPFSETPNEDWQGIHIMTAIPERRLFAFDLESGRPLWDHTPPLGWDGTRFHWDGGGSYAQRMMVAAPPVVSGSRVLVPCYRMQGRIDYHVACYELETGELLWSTPVVSGQRERNMFGRPRREFAASPLVVTGERVIAQTELGTVAALDLLTGRVLWQSLYRQIELPKTRSYNTPERAMVWRLSPPLVVGELVLATPADSQELVAFRLEDGSVPWAYGEDELQRLDRDTEHLGFNLLLGADKDTIYLSGGKVSALQKPGGLASRSPFFEAWTYALPREHEPPERSPRAVLARDALLVPTQVERIALDRRSGARLSAFSAAWSRTTSGSVGGNVWVDSGALFVLSDGGVSGYFDWDLLLERARVASERSPSDTGAQLASAQLFLRRGLLALEADERDLALGVLEQARALFHELRRARASALSSEDLAKIQELELSTLRALAEIRFRQGDLYAALSILEEARGFPVEGLALRDLLLQQERCLAELDPSRRTALLNELLERCAELPLPESLWSADGSAPAWLARDSGQPLALPPAPPAGLGIGPWARLERAHESAARGAIQAALEDLHQALAQHGELELSPGVTLGGVLRERITTLLARPGARAAYAPFEERAAELYRAARERRDPAGLEEVARRFPHSQAAEQALEERLAHALDAGDARAVAQLVRAALEGGTHALEAEAQLLLRLGNVLGRAGNTAFERALLVHLSRRYPDLVSEVPAHGGRPLARLVQDLPAEAAGAPGSPARFDARIVTTGRASEGAHEFLGVLPPAAQPPEEAPRELHAYLTTERISVFSSEDPGTPLWSFPLADPLEAGSAACTLSTGRVLFGDAEGVHALDDQGRLVWSHSTRRDLVRRVAVASGVLVANLRSGSLLALDVVAGIPLWEQALRENANWTGPLCGPDQVVLLSRRHAQAPRALVIDLFRGRVESEFELSEKDSSSPLELTSWIQAGRLVVPTFGSRRSSGLTAYSLPGGQRAWSFEFGNDEELFALARCEGKDYAITLPVHPGNPAANGGVYLLDPDFGSARMVVSLGPGEEPMGLTGNARTQLSSPYLFTYAPSAAEPGIPVRAIHLPYQVIWRWSLPVTSQEFYDDRGLPLPAVSADCVAIAYQTKNPQSGLRAGWTIEFVDKRAGKRLGNLVLSEKLAAARTLELRGLGEALFVLGRGGSARGMRLEILEAMR